jgi:hypothetical protein
MPEPIEDTLIQRELLERLRLEPATFHVFEVVDFAVTGVMFSPTGDIVPRVSEVMRRIDPPIR